MFYNLKCLYLVSCQTLLPFVYSSFDLNVCVIDSLGNMWISCLCLYSSADLSLQNQSELVLRDSPQFLLYKIFMFDCSPSSLWVPWDSLCWSFLQKAPIKYRYLWSFQPLECPDFHHISQEVEVIPTPQLPHRAPFSSHPQLPEWESANSGPLFMAHSYP